MRRKLSFSIVALNLFLFLGLGVCFVLPYFRGDVLYFRDIFHNYYPLIDFMKGALQAGELPFWNPFLFTGTPQMAGLEPALFYPPAWPFFFMGFSSALYLNLVIHYFFAGWGLFLLLKQSRLHAMACTLGAITWVFSGSLVSLNNMHPLLNTIVWLPWLLWAVQKFCMASSHRLKWRYGSFFAIFYGFQILSGHLELVYASSLLIFLYFLSLWWQGKARFLQAFPFALFVILGVTLSFIQLLPSLEYQHVSARMFGVTLSESQFFSAHPLMFLNLCLSRLSGDLRGLVNLQRVIGDPVLKQNLLFSSYLGIVGCLGLLLSLRERRKEVYFWWVVAIGCAFLSVGRFAPVYTWFWKYFPGVSLFRYPEKAWLFLSFACSILAAWGIQGLLEQPNILSKKRFYLVFIGLFGLGLWGMLNVDSLASDWVTWGAAPLRVSVEEWVSVYSQHLRSSFGLSLAGLCCVLLLLLYLKQSKKTERVGLLLVLLATVDLVYNAQYYLWYADQSLFTLKPQIVEFFDQHLDSQYRYFMPRAENRIPAYFTDLYGNARLEETLFRRAYMEDNQGVLFDYQSVDGFWPAKPAKSTVLLSLYNQGAQHGYFDRIYESLWGVKYIMLVAPTREALIRLKQSALHKRVAQYEQTLTYVYENKTVLPRVRFQTDYIAVPRLSDMFAIWEAPEKYGYDYTKHLLLLDDEKFQEAKQQVQVQKADEPEWSPPAFLEEHNNSLRIGFETNTSGFLVLADQYMPGWKAYDNGQEVPILQANFSQRALRVGPGKHDIRFEYEPPGFAWGWKISLLSGLLLLLILGASFRYKTDLQPSAY